MKKSQKVLVDKEVSEMLRKGAIRICQSTQTISKLPFSGREERWGSSSCDKFEEIEQAYPLSAIQNGGFALPKIHVTAGALHLQIGHERCIFFNPLILRVLRVHLPMFRAGSSSKNFPKNFKSSNVIIEKIEHTNYHLFGRHVDIGTNSEGNSNGKGHSNFPVATFGFCNKSKEISTQTSTANEVLRTNCELSNALSLTKEK